ncbi:cystathionine gamma-synthase [Anoxybacillus flavithermus]|uniref:cysteine-S-conjugate beta-lyase n=2 Tax=Anoxybacillus TaxID=150247 RepID=A0A2G5RUG3_9BACL|nr:cystathionine beta-lyase [Anoxybacillus flavithermus]PIC06302.1 cystathionine gamma-synthase [Anoxybacillus flavithermus]
MDIQTRLVHNKWQVDAQTGAVSVPIHHASTFHQFDFDTFGKYDYSRSGNPTREALEETIAELEGGVSGFAFASGMAAISTAFLLLSKGDHVLITDDVYGGTYRIITDVFSRLGIEYTFVDMTDLDTVARHIRPNTKVIYMETPSNPLLKITDIRGVVKLAKAHGCLTFLDNTFATPLLQRPLDLGVDVVLHSATKFLAGHSDVVAGLAVVKDERLAKELRKLQYAFGAVLGVQDAWLVLRGLKTLHVRLDYASRSAMQLAQFLHRHPKVAHVYYPGLSHHEGHVIHREQARGFGAVLSFELENEQAVRTFVKYAYIPVFAVSLGAVESILSYPAKMSHAAMPKAERLRRGITDGLLRISVGLEAIDDLIADFEQALSYV